MNRYFIIYTYYKGPYISGRGNFSLIQEGYPSRGYIKRFVQNSLKDEVTTVTVENIWEVTKEDLEDFLSEVDLL